MTQCPAALPLSCLPEGLFQHQPRGLVSLRGWLSFKRVVRAAGLLWLPGLGPVEWTAGPGSLGGSAHVCAPLLDSDTPTLEPLQAGRFLHWLSNPVSLERAPCLIRSPVRPACPFQLVFMPCCFRICAPELLASGWESSTSIFHLPRGQSTRGCG